MIHLVASCHDEDNKNNSFILDLEGGDRDHLIEVTA